MVTGVGSIADFFKRRGRIVELEREFTVRRNIVQKQVLNDPKRYLALFSTEQLEGQILMYNGLALEASRLDDEYRKIMGPQQTDPNYQQLIIMNRGVKNIIRREIEHRKRYSEV